MSNGKSSIWSIKLGKSFLQMECLADFEINELSQNMELVKS